MYDAPAVSYENYQLQWMMDHGYSLQDLMRSMDEYYAGEDTSIRTFEECFNQWQKEYGFHHELWTSKEEAMNTGECIDYPIESTKDENDSPNYILVYCENDSAPQVFKFLNFDDAYEYMSIQYDYLMQKHFINKRDKEQSFCETTYAELHIRKKTYHWNIKMINHLPVLNFNPEKKEYLLICSGERITITTKHFRTMYSAEKAMKEEFEKLKTKYHPNSSKEEQKKYDKLSEVRGNHAILYYRNEEGNEDTFNWRIVEREKC